MEQDEGKTGMALERALQIVEKAATRCERASRGGGGKAQRASYRLEAEAFRIVISKAREAEGAPHGREAEAPA